MTSPEASTDPLDAMFSELCAQLGFCSLGVEGEVKVRAALGRGPEEAARAIFAAEGLDYDAYDREGVKTAVRECVARHLNPETHP